MSTPIGILNFNEALSSFFQLYWKITNKLEENASINLREFYTLYYVAQYEAENRILYIGLLEELRAKLYIPELCLEYYFKSLLSKGYIEFVEKSLDRTNSYYRMTPKGKKFLIDFNNKNANELNCIQELGNFSRIVCAQVN